MMIERGRGGMRGGSGAQVQPLDVGVQIPYHFRCPISLELMSDPVTVSTGQTYDRSSIESWVSAGHTTCPVTRVPLENNTLIPNHTLRRLIQDWCVQNRSSGVERIPTPKQPPDPALLRSLFLRASSLSSSTHSRLSALRRLRALARDSERNHSLMALASPDAAEALISVLFSDEPSELADESLALLVMLPLSEPDCLSVSSRPERVSCLVRLLRFHSSLEVRVNAAALVEIVAVGTRSPDARARISGAEEIFEGVVSILTNDGPARPPRAAKVAIRALFALCLVKQTRQNAVSAGAVEALVGRLPDLEKCDGERALATLELLCRVPTGCAALLAHAATVPLLVKTILKVSDRATEYAAGALLSLCSASEEAQREAVAAGVLTQLLLLVQSDCTERAKRKAQLLLKLLRDSWPEDSVGNSDDFGCSEVVPF